jgi:TPR repeat protein
VKAALAVALLGIGWAVSAENIRPDTTRDGQEWMGGVHSALEHRDCKLAVARLNQGLERRYPDAFLLAGAMFEQGLCVKTEWDRAATMYQRALAVGHGGGQFRLVAGLAERGAPVALWWAQERDAVMLPDECRVPAEAHRRAEACAAAKARDSLRRYLDEVGRRALARFKGPPAGLAPDAVLRVQHILTVR